MGTAFKTTGGEVQSSEAESVAHIVDLNNRPIEIKPDGVKVPLIIFPKTGLVESLERFQTKPTRKRGTVTVSDHTSFIEYVKAHMEPGTILLAKITETGGSFTAVLDYHKPTEGIAGSEPLQLADWAEHSCIYSCEHSPEWKRWIAIDKKNWEQAELAQFIEDNRLDIKTPDGGTMLDIVKSLEATAGVEFKSAVRLDNGDRRINYVHTTSAKAGQNGDITIPELFVLNVPVFVNGPAYDLMARFRYSIAGGPLKLRIEFLRAHKTVELAMSEARNAITTTLGKPVLLGSLSVPKV